MYLQKQKEKRQRQPKIISSKLILGLLVLNKKASKANNPALLEPYGQDMHVCQIQRGGKKKHNASATHTLSHYHLTVTL